MEVMQNYDIKSDSENASIVISKNLMPVLEDLFEAIPDTPRH